jgi:uncharacterized membrane protein
MNILLLNQNPVVEKLVTLSAHKLGATVVSVRSTEELEVGDYDLLIVDEEVYGFEIFGDLTAKVTYKKSLYLHARDSEPVDIFNYQIKKPFLPTDLVELLSKIAHAITEGEGKKSDDFEDDQNADETFENFDDSELEDEQNESETFENLDTLDEDLTSLSGSDDTDDSFLDDDFADNLMEEDEDVGEEQQILDQDDVQEVQKLLEDEESDGDDLFISDLNDISDTEEPNKEDTQALLKSELDEIIANDFHDDEQDKTALEDEKMPEEDLLVEEPQEDIDLTTEALLKGELDEIIANDFHDDEQDETEPEPVDEVEMDDEKLEEDVELSTEELKEDEDISLESLEAKIEDEVSKLDDETLNTPIDEEMLDELDDESLDELSLLDEDMLKTAIGEGDEVIDESDLEADDLRDEDMIPDLQVETDNGSEALKTLLKALESEDVKASLKGMKIDIHISIGPAK